MNPVFRILLSALIAAVAGLVSLYVFKTSATWAYAIAGSWGGVSVVALRMLFPVVEVEAVNINHN